MLLFRLVSPAGIDRACRHASVCAAVSMVFVCSSCRTAPERTSAGENSRAAPASVPAPTTQVAPPPAGWLTTRGSRILVSDGKGGGTVWVGRGVNVDDLFLCGFNCRLDLSSSGELLGTLVAGLVREWRPTFLRISLWMASCPEEGSWTIDPARYRLPMTSIIEAAGRAGAYVLVTVRSHPSMIGQDAIDGDPEATGIPSDPANTPDPVLYPRGTDETYTALVDSFADAGFVLFGVANEPGGDKLSNARIAASMKHAVEAIRAEEDRLGVPHHLVSVQGNGWTDDIAFYAASPLPFDGVVYEVHGYPPKPSSYTYSNIPVIVGEYGSLEGDAAARFYADVEAKQIPTLAWDFDTFSDCGPDLVAANESATELVPTGWGRMVRAYLLAHAR
jgi:hypothetical protein